MLVDRDTFPSETVSTHLIFPNTLARMEQLGVLDTLLAAHDVPILGFRIIGFGHESAGRFTPLDGFDHAAAPRRSALDKAFVDSALAAGADGRFGERVVDLIGAGTAEDPVAGVVLESGERTGARWVLGADGRGSTVAGRLGIEKTHPLSGEVAFLFAYWRGIRDDGYATLDISPDAILSSWAVEDGMQLLVVAGNAEFTRGSKEERRRRYLERLRDFPQTIEPDVLERAEMASDLIVAPESLMRGFFRTPTGPGWARLGSARLVPATSSIRAPPKALATPSSRRSAWPGRCRAPTRASGPTQTGATRAPPSTTSGRSRGGGFRGRRRRACLQAGQASPMPLRTFGTPSAALWSPPRC